MAVNGNGGNLTVQGYGNDYVSTTTGTGAGWLVQSAVLNGSSLSHFKDGVAIDGPVTTTHDTVVSRIALADEIGGAGDGEVLDIAAVYIYDGALSTTDREAIETYLTDKYLTVPDLPPAAPTGLVATGGVEEIGLTWDANVELDVTGYNVYRSETAETINPSVDTPLAFVTVGTETYTDTTATPAVEYFYAITAVDDDPAESGLSNEDSATATADLPPVAPTGLGAVAGDGVVDLSWDANGEGDLAGYTIYRSTTGSIDPTNGTTYDFTDTVGTDPAPSYSDTSVVNGTEYFYVVTATDDDPAESGPSQ